MKKNYFQVLGLDSTATLDEIKKAYRIYVIKYHPDKNNGDKFFEERFKEVSEAYEYLLNNINNTRFEEKSTFLNSYYSQKNNINITLLTEKLKKEEKIRKHLEKELLIRESKIKEINQYNLKENIVYLNKGNIFINGNRIKVNNIVISINDIKEIKLKTISNLKKRIRGYFLLILGLSSIFFLIGFIFLYFAIKYILKKDTYQLNILSKNSLNSTIDIHEKSFADEIYNSLQKTINAN